MKLKLTTFLKKVVAENGKLDIVFNGIGANYDEMGGRPPTTVATFEQFMAPIEKICGSQFLTSRVAAKYMMQTQSEGTILLLTAAVIHGPNFPMWQASRLQVQLLKE